MPVKNVSNGKILTQLGELTGTVVAIKKEIERNREESNRRDDEILDAINKMKKDVHENIKYHRKYHEENEERWGLFAWMRNHTKQVIIVALLGGIALATLWGVTINKIYAWVRIVNTAIK